MSQGVDIKLTTYVTGILLYAALGLVIAASTISATAVVTVTVLGTNSSRGGISVFPPQLEISRNGSAQLTIFNHSKAPRDIQAALVSRTADGGCKIHYAPKLSSIPPDTPQVLRILAHSPGTNACQLDHTLVIVDQQKPGEPLFEIPIGNKNEPDNGEFFFGGP